MDVFNTLNLLCKILELNAYCREGIIKLTLLTTQSMPENDLVKGRDDIQELISQLRYANTGVEGNLSTLKNVQLELLFSAKESIQIANSLFSQLIDSKSGNQSAIFTEIAVLFSKLLEQKLQKSLSQNETTLRKRLIPKLWNAKTAEIEVQDEFTLVEPRLKELLDEFIQYPDALKEPHEKGIVEKLAVLTTESPAPMPRSNTRPQRPDTQRTDPTPEQVKAERKKFMDTLRYASLNARKDQVDEAHAETFKWVFKVDESDDHAAFPSWLRSDEPLFWINGKAGSGKSTLMKFLCESTHTLDAIPGYSIYSYYFWKSGYETQRNLSGLFAHFLYQMLDENKTFLDDLLAQCPKFLLKERWHEWKLKDLQIAFQTILSYHKNGVCVFIDGLDEIGTEKGAHKLRNTLESLILNNKKLKICVSSRPESIWVDSLNKYPSLRLQDLTRNDMTNLARDMLKEKFGEVVKGETEFETLVRITASKANGVFLWIYIALRALSTADSPPQTFLELRDQIIETPSDMYALYQTMWARLGPNESYYRKEAAKIFRLMERWDDALTFSGGARTFHLVAAYDSELRSKIFTGGLDFIKSFEFKEFCGAAEKRIEGICAGLVEFTSDTDNWLFGGTLGDRISEVLCVWYPDPRIKTIAFLHRTARDFLFETQEGHRFLDECPRETADIGIIHALLAQVKVDKKNIYSDAFGRGSQGFDSVSWVYWSLPDDSALTKVVSCCGELRNPRSALWRASSSEIFELVKEAFEERSFSNFYETIAKVGIKAPVLKCLEGFNPQSNELKAMHSYLTWPSLQYCWFDSRRDAYIRYMFNHGPDLQWKTIHSAKLLGQGIPQMLTFLESILLRAQQVTPKFIDFVQILRDQKFDATRKVFVPLHLRESRFHRGGIEYGLYTPNLDSPQRISRTGKLVEEENFSDILIGLNIAQLLNDVLSRGLLTLKATKADFALRAKIESMLFKNNYCFREVICVGNFSKLAESEPVPHLSIFKMKSAKQKVYVYATDYDDEDYYIFKGSQLFKPEWGRYCAPTAAEQATILKGVDLLNDVKTYSEGSDKGARQVIDSLHILVEETLSSKTQRIVSIAEMLRQKGYFVPREEDVHAFQDAEDMASRVWILDELNQRSGDKVECPE